MTMTIKWRGIAEQILRDAKNFGAEDPDLLTMGEIGDEFDALHNMISVWTMMLTLALEEDDNADTD